MRCMQACKQPRTACTQLTRAGRPLEPRPAWPGVVLAGQRQPRMARTQLTGAMRLQEPRLAWPDVVLADIGDAQDLRASLSTFSGHVRRLAGILSSVTPDSLVVLDEVGALSAMCCC